MGTSSCGKLGIKVEVPSVEWCASTGKLGALCQNSTNKEIRRRLSLDQFLKFLQADVASKKGPALCISSYDYTRVKNALETLCYKAGKFCDYEAKKLLKEVLEAPNTLQAEALK